MLQALRERSYQEEVIGFAEGKSGHTNLIGRGISCRRLRGTSSLERIRPHPRFSRIQSVDHLSSPQATSWSVATVG